MTNCHVRAHHSRNLDVVPEEAESTTAKEREERAGAILRRFKHVCRHLSSVRSIFTVRRDSSRIREWALDIEFALKRVGLVGTKVLLDRFTRQQHSQANGFKTIRKELGLTPEECGVMYAFALNSFLTEMDRLNRLGTPDDYADEWGMEAAERRQSEMATLRALSVGECATAQ